MNKMSVLHAAALAALATVAVGDVPARGQFGGMMSPQAARSAAGFGGMGGQEEQVPPPKSRAAMTREAARVWAKLRQTIDVPFANETPISDVLDHFRDATRTDKEDDTPLQFYVDPVGLQEAEKTLASPVTLKLDRVPLASALDLILKQLDLTYFVRPDGIVLITSASEGHNSDVLVNSVPPLSADAARVWEQLLKPVSMPFANDTPLEDVIRYIKSATMAEDFPNGLPIYLDPKGLEAAEASESTPVRLNLEGLPLTATLALLLKQIGLAYHVEDSGLLLISDEATIGAKRTPVLDGERVAELEAAVESLKAERDQLVKQRAAGAEPAPRPAASKPGGLQ